MMVLEPFPIQISWKSRSTRRNWRLESFPMRRIDPFMDETGSGLVSTQTLVSNFGIDTKFNQLNQVYLRKIPVFVLKSCYQPFKGGATEENAFDF